METNQRVKVTVYAVSGAWSLALFLAGIKLPGVTAKVLSALPIIVVGAFALFDNWLWRWRPIHRFVRRPNLSGTWTGEFKAIWDSDGTGERVQPPKPMFLVIRQTFIGLHVSFITGESGSHSFAEDLQQKVGDQFVVYYQYTNTPSLELRPTSPIHDGGARLSVSGRSPTRISGEYWTNRSTRGTFEVARVCSEHAGTWQEAQELKVAGGST